MIVSKGFRRCLPPLVLTALAIFFMMVSYSLAGEKNLLAPFDTNQCMDATIDR